jgi:hypothetical protein
LLLNDLFEWVGAFPYALGECIHEGYWSANFRYNSFKPNAIYESFMATS